MRLRGTDMSWYEKAKQKSVISDDGLIPIDNEACSSLSIYFLKEDGSLWTLTSEGALYKRVRYGQKSISHAIYVCMHCKTQWRETPTRDGVLKHP
jgi:hypothetical protein